ncbi:MAG: Glu-tRNA(Gln) amidotransferase subunit GatE [Candidatus Thorarchaeota archaeon]|nr:Glu-tRNA(Gln) amidotransferase subunit GatE [Candidatus Thorarchaeota archaeon]
MESDKYALIGLKVGLELHQQIDSPRKLFCHCPALVSNRDPDGGFVRRLRPTQSEMGEVDPSALFEFQRNRRFYYEYYNDITCLVEADEEPPHSIDEDSIDVCLTVACLLKSKPVDEIHPMRKIVIDGSNTTGFQRTAVVALGGQMRVGGRQIGIQTISLEEDAARKISDDDVVGTRVYRLDRLGIPLIEIATAPDIHTPEEAQEVALALGLLLRSTRRVKRGLGTIRQDVNVSIEGGAITEIKGLQELELLGKVVELESLRQVNLLQIRDELIERGVRPEDIVPDFVDVTRIFEKTESKMIRRALDSDGIVSAVRLRGFAGLLGREVQPGRRLGTEMSDHAKFWGGVGGLFHTDELPKYGITDNDVEQLRLSTKAEPEDAVVLVAAGRQNCIDALDAVVRRAKEAVTGVPAETRVPLPDGTTKFARPRPGAKRMYPETDVRPVRVSASRLRGIRRSLPETLDATESRLINELGLSRDLASRVVRSANLDLFERAVRECKASPTLVATTLENTLTSLHREGVPIERLSDAHFMGLFQAVTSGGMSQEAIPSVLSYLAEHPDSTVTSALHQTGLGKLEPREAQEILHRLVESRAEYVRSQGERAIGGLMGVAMKELRGKIDGSLVKEILLNEIRALLE